MFTSRVYGEFLKDSRFDCSLLDCDTLIYSSFLCLFIFFFLTGFFNLSLLLPAFYPFFSHLSLPNLCPDLCCCCSVPFIVYSSCPFASRWRRWEEQEKNHISSGAATDRWTESSSQMSVAERGGWREGRQREIREDCCLLCRLIQSWCSVAMEICWSGFLQLLQHGVQLVGQVVKHAADVVEDAHRGLLLSHRAGCKQRHRQKITAPDRGLLFPHWRIL